VDPPAEPVSFLLHGDRIVEVLGGLGIDREAELLAQIDTFGQIGLGSLVRLELGVHTRVHEQPLEHDLDVLRLAELALDLRAAAARADDGKVSGPDVAAAFPVDRDGDVRDEVRLADEQLAALVDLDD
jgi:hypothetical protein